MKTVASAYELKKHREYAKKRKEEQKKTDQEARRNHFNWDNTTTGHQNDISFTDYLLDILIEDGGKLFKMYKRIRVQGKRLDVTGTGAIREITRKIKEAGGDQITPDAIRGKIRRIENLFKQVSRYQFQTGRGVDEDGLTVEEQMKRDCPRFEELSEILGDRCRSSARPYNTGHSIQELTEPRGVEAELGHFSRESVAGPSTPAHRVIAGGSNDPSDKVKGKQKLVLDVVLGGTPRRSPVATIAEEYLGKSLSIKKKEAKARLMIEFIQHQAKDTAEDPAETEKKVKKAIDDIFK